MIAFRDYCRQHDADQRFCTRIWELGDKQWSGAERVWRQLLDHILDDIKDVDSRAERQKEALKRAKKWVLPQRPGG